MTACSLYYNIHTYNFTATHLAESIEDISVTWVSCIPKYPKTFAKVVFQKPSKHKISYLSFFFFRQICLRVGNIVNTLSYEIDSHTKELSSHKYFHSIMVQNYSITSSTLACIIVFVDNIMFVQQTQLSLSKHFKRTGSKCFCDMRKDLPPFFYTHDGMGHCTNTTGK